MSPWKLLLEGGRQPEPQRGRGRVGFGPFSSGSIHAGGSQPQAGCVVRLARTMAGSAQSQEHLGVGGPELGGGAARLRMKTRLGGRGVGCGALTLAACGGRPARTRRGTPPAAVNPLARPAAGPRPVPAHRLRCRGWGSSACSRARVCSRLALQTESEPPSRAQAGDLPHPLAFAGFATPQSSRWGSIRASDLPSDDTLGKPDGARETQLK